MKKPIESHPGKLLRDHLMNVLKLGLTEFRSRVFQFVNPNEIDQLIQIVLITHDFGKATTYFQDKLRSGTSGDEKANHGMYSALFTYYIASHVLTDPLLPFMGCAAVARHHGNLKDFRDLLELNDHEWATLKQQFAQTDLDTLDEILHEAGFAMQLKNIAFEELQGGLEPKRFRKTWRSSLGLFKLEHYLIVNLVYSLLIFADKGDAIFYSKQRSFEELQSAIITRSYLPADLVDRYKHEMGWDQSSGAMNEMRNRIYGEIIKQAQRVDLKNKIFSINVPTGTGKTLGTLSAALHLRARLREEKGMEPRIIYSLPFTSIIDQNFEVFQQVLENNGITPTEKILMKCHHLTPKTFKKGVNDNDEIPDIAEYMVEIWNSEIIVTTFVQLLHTIFSHQNRALKKFHQLANSIILLDEVQSIPHSYWVLIRETFTKLGEIFNCYFIFVTATMPLMFDEKEGEIIELAKSKEEYFAFFDRIDLDLSRINRPMVIDSFKEFIAQEIQLYENQSFLIVLNTVGTSIDVYKHLKEKANVKNLVYLSTNIIPRDRLKRIQRIKNAKKPLVIVSTQMIEAGVDIDIDRVYRDLSPLDSINQTCGRCNRNFSDTHRGKVTLIHLINENHHNQKFGYYVYGEFLLSETDQILRKMPDLVHEKDFYLMNQEYFQRVNQGKSDDQSEKLLERMRQLKYTQAFEDDSEVTKGKSLVFTLIDKNEATVNFFIEKNSRAKNIWHKYMNIQQISDPFVKKAEFELIKSEFLSYIVTIPLRIGKKRLNTEQLERTFNYISREQVKTVYDLKTGFIRDEEEGNCFF